MGSFEKIKSKTFWQKKLKVKPSGIHEKMKKHELKRLKKELNLQNKNISPKPEFNAYNYIKYLHEQNPPSLSCICDSIDEHSKWKKRALQKLKELTGFENERVSLEPRVLKQTEFENIVLKKISFNSAPGLKAIGVLCHPKNITRKLPSIIALNGHNNGKINTLGLQKSKSNSYYGMDLAMQGFITFSLDQWGWGERTGKYKKIVAKPEETFSRSSMLLGKPALGIRAWDVSRAIDYLETLEITNNRFGVIGQSGGGAGSMYASALDHRIEAAVISGHFCSAKFGLCAIGHCTCAYVPNLLKYLDIPDIVSIRAPKPTFIVSGEFDPLFPKDGVLDGYSKLEKIYTLYGKQENLGLDIIPGMPHFFRGKKAYPWLRKIFFDDPKRRTNEN